MKKLPYLTLALTVVSIVIHVLGEPVRVALEWRSDALGAAEAWRLATGHLTHWSGQHLLWDAAMFLLLGTLLETRGRGKFLGTLALAVLLTEAFLQIGANFASYRGLSAFAMALFALASLEALAFGVRSGRRAAPAVGGVGLTLLGGKLGYELLRGEALWVDAREGLFTVALEAHLAGALAPLCFLAVQWLGLRLCGTGGVLSSVKRVREGMVSPLPSAPDRPSIAPGSGWKVRRGLP